MALIGLSLLFASVVWVLVRPPRWLPALFLQWRGLGGSISEGPGQTSTSRGQPSRTDNDTNPRKDARQKGADRSDEAVMPPPPVPRLPVVQPPADDAVPRIAEPEAGSEAEEQMTPRADPAVPSIAVPSFSLSSDEPSPGSSATTSAMAPPPLPSARREPQPGNRLPSLPQFPAMNSPQRAQGPQPGRLPPVPQFPAANSPQRAQGPQPGRLPVVPQFPAANSAQRAQGPLPNRGPPGSSSSSSSGLAPPPTHSSKPSKPSRKVLLSPGHSPLDWARISGPNADLRGLGASTPYLRVTPSMLKKQTGRKGKDAWMALNGKVYNVTPYAEFHPGGVPELMRGAGRDATQLFGEIHPWVNYESMLSACLVGLLVDEPEGQESEMDKMD